MGSIIKLNRKDFSKEIEHQIETKKCSYIDSVLFLCEKYNIEPESVKPLITKPIKEKLEAELRERNLLPKTNTIV